MHIYLSHGLIADGNFAQPTIIKFCLIPSNRNIDNKNITKLVPKYTKDTKIVHVTNLICIYIYLGLIMKYRILDSMVGAVTVLAAVLCQNER